MSYSFGKVRAYGGKLRPSHYYLSDSRLTPPLQATIVEGKQKHYFKGRIDIVNYARFSNYSDHFLC
jgi:hypothetical protein